MPKCLAIRSLFPTPWQHLIFHWKFPPQDNYRNTEKSWGGGWTGHPCCFEPAPISLRWKEVTCKKLWYTAAANSQQPYVCGWKGEQSVDHQQLKEATKHGKIAHVHAQFPFTDLREGWELPTKHPRRPCQGSSLSSNYPELCSGRESLRQFTLPNILQLKN